MVSYQEYTQSGLNGMSESIFNKAEPVAAALLSSMCGDTWSAESEVCKKAVIAQLDYIQGGQDVSSWLCGGSSEVSGRSYSIGGESESISYSNSSSNGRAKRFVYNGLEVAPYAIAILRSAGLYKPVQGVRVW